MKKNYLFFCLIGLFFISCEKEEVYYVSSGIGYTYEKWVDLGLPSGTLWADKSQSGLYTYNEAINQFGNNIPTKEQLQELIDNCKWEWIGNGNYKLNVIGSNGSIIVMHGEREDCCYGDYCSRTYDVEGSVWHLSINGDERELHQYGRSELLVHLVKN